MNIFVYNVCSYQSHNMLYSLECLNEVDVGQHNKAIDDKSQRKVHTDERTRVYSASSSSEVHRSKY